MEALVFLFALLLLVGAAGAAIALAQWVAQPIKSLAQSRRAPRQFALADLLVLLAMLQCVVGTIHFLQILLGSRTAEPGSAAAGDVAASALTVDAMFAVLLLLSWWFGVRMVSRAGISRWWHRAIVVGIVAPWTTISVLATVVLAILQILFLNIGNLAKEPSVLCVLCLALVSLGVCGVATRWLAAKYLPSAIAAAPESAPISQPPSTSPGE